MRAWALGITIACCFSSFANAQRAMAMIEGYCNEEFAKSKKPENEREAYFEACFKRKRAENEKTAASQPASSVVMKASFDCSKAKSASARLICSDPALSEADRELGEVFQSLIARLDAAQKRTRLEEQVKWIRERNTRCGLDNKQNAAVSELKPSWQCIMNALLDRKAQFTGEVLAPSQVGTFVKPLPTTASALPEQTNFADLLKTSPMTVHCNGFMGDGFAMPPGAPLSTQNLLKAGIQLSKSIEKRSFSDSNFENAMMSFLNKTARDFCDKEIAAGRAKQPISEAFVLTLVHETGNGRTDVWSPDGGRSWIYTDNALQIDAKDLLRQDVERERAQEASRQRQAQVNQIAQQKQTLRTKVASDLGYQQYVYLQDVSANPFRFKGIVVALQVNFERMMTETEAIFGNNGQELFVSGVPSTLFSGNEQAILGVRISGTKPVKTPVGEATLPSGEYVGAYKCTQFGCPEYFDN